MDTDDLDLQDTGPSASKVDGFAERKIMAAYTKDAHEKAVCREVERIQRRQTLKELLVLVLSLVALWLLTRHFIPEYILPVEHWIKEIICAN